MYMIELVKNEVAMEKCVHQLAVQFKMMFKHTYASMCMWGVCMFIRICMYMDGTHQLSF